MFSTTNLKLKSQATSSIFRSNTISSSSSSSSSTSYPITMTLDYGKKRKEMEDFPLNLKSIRVNGNNNNIFASISGINLSNIDYPFVVEFQSLNRMLLCSSIASKTQSYDSEFSLIEPSQIKSSPSNEKSIQEMVQMSLNGEFKGNESISKEKSKDDVFFMYNKNKHDKLSNKFDIGFTGRSMYFISKSNKFCDVNLSGEKFPICFKPFLQKIGSSAKEVNLFKFNVNVYKIISNIDGLQSLEPIAKSIESEPFTVFGKNLKIPMIKRIIKNSENPLLSQYLKSNNCKSEDTMVVEQSQPEKTITSDKDILSDLEPLFGETSTSQFDITEFLNSMVNTNEELQHKEEIKFDFSINSLLDEPDKKETQIPTMFNDFSSEFESNHLDLLDFDIMSLPQLGISEKDGEDEYFDTSSFYTQNETNEFFF